MTNRFKIIAMKYSVRILSSILLFVSSVFTSYAQNKAPKSLLWEVSGKNISAPSYLYGTFHLICPDDLQVSNVITDKLDASKKLFLEMDMDDPSVMQKVQMGMLLKDTSWKSLLTETEYNALADSFKQITKMPVDMFTRIKPFGVLSFVMMGMMNCQLASWDLTLAEKAKQKHIEVKGLETPERELEALETLSLQEQTDMLKEMLGNPDSTRKSIQEMVRIYRDKDLTALEKVMTGDKHFGSMETELLIKRNNEWVPVIEKQLQTEPTFFAFGAGHLGGENGIINLLKKKGYKVKAIVY